MPDRYRFRDRMPHEGEGKLPRAEVTPQVTGNVARVYLYDVIDDWGGYWGVSSSEFAEALEGLPADVDTIELRINSPGGMVFEAIAIKNLLAAHSARVVAIVDGLAASAASFIAVAADEVVMGENTELMIHDAHTIARGDAAGFRSLADDLDRVSDNIASIYAKRTGGDLADWREVMIGERWYSAQEAVDAGLADRVGDDDGATTDSALEQRRLVALSVVRGEHTQWVPDGTGVAAAAISTTTPNEKAGQQADTAPSATAETGAPRSEDPNTPNASKEEVMARMSIEEREARITEINARLTDIDAANTGDVLNADDKAEWDSLLEEKAEHEAAITAQQQRTAALQAVASNPAATESAEQVESRSLTATARASASAGGRAAAVHIKPETLYDVAGIRAESRSPEDRARRLRDHAMRAVEIARFAGADREKAQHNVATLLDTVEDGDSTLARRVLNTGNPAYQAAFGKAVMAGGVTGGLNPDELRALSLGSDADGGYAVPFELDPTVILTNDGYTSPMRQLARVVQMTGKKWEGLTSAGTTASREGETDEVANSDPSFVQPVVDTSRVDVEVEFSVALEASWAGLSSELSNIIADALQAEEATVFITGAGTALTTGGTLPQGILTGLSATTATYKVTAATGTLSLADLRATKTALGERWRGNTAWLAADTFYDEAESKATQVTIDDIINSGLTGEGQRPLLRKPGYEASGMPDFATSSNSNLAIYGNVGKAYIIADRIGFNLELIPHMLGANRRPNGKRGLWGYRFNGGKLIVPSACVLLRMK